VEDYDGLLNKVSKVSGVLVRDAFKSSCGHDSHRQGSCSPQSTCTPVQVQAQSVVMEDVAAVLQSHIEWDSGPRVRAVEVLQHLLTMIESSLVSCSMWRGVGDLQGERSSESLLLSKSASNTGTNLLSMMVFCTEF